MRYGVLMASHRIQLNPGISYLYSALYHRSGSYTSYTEPRCWFQHDLSNIVNPDEVISGTTVPGCNIQVSKLPRINRTVRKLDALEATVLDSNHRHLRSMPPRSRYLVVKLDKDRAVGCTVYTLLTATRRRTSSDRLPTVP